MLGRRAARPRLQQPAAGQQRHNAQHLGGGAQLQDGKQIREVVAQYISRHADRVEAGARTRAGLRHGGDRGGEGDVQPGGVGVLGQVALRQSGQVTVVRSHRVQPENRLFKKN